MLRKFGFQSLLAAGLLIAAPAHSDEGKTMTQDQEKVLTAVKNMTDAFHRRDLDGIMNQYESAAAIAFEPGHSITRRAIIKQLFQDAFMLSPQFNYSGHEVMIVDDLALHIAPWTMQGKLPDGQTITQTGLSVSALRKQSDGSWLLVIDNPHGNHLLPRN